MSLRSTARDAKSFKRSFDRAVRAFAWYAGWLGMLALVVTAVLWILPERDWEHLLPPERLPLYILVALLFASLVGWSYVNEGEDRIRRRIGKRSNLVAFVVLPLACMAAELFQDRIAAVTGMQPPGHPFWLTVRWYPPALVVLSAGMFLLWKSKPRRRIYLDRGLVYAAFLTPYALLFAYLVVGVYVDWLDASMRESLAPAGAFGIALHLVLAYFIGSD